MILKQHKSLTVEKWATFSFGKQILMIANELNRAKNWVIKKDFTEALLCYERAMELLYLTIANTKKRPLLLELCRFKEMLAELYNTGKPGLNQNKLLYDTVLKLSPESYNLLNPKPNT